MTHFRAKPNENDEEKKRDKLRKRIPTHFGEQIEFVSKVVHTNTLVSLAFIEERVEFHP